MKGPVIMTEKNSPRFKFSRAFAFTTERPVAIFMIVIAVVVFGWVSYTRLPVNLMPDISYPSLTVRTEYPGASPYEVESSVSIPVEQALGVIDNLETLSSTSKAGLSDVVLEFSWDTDMNRAVQDTRESLDQIFLPDDAERPLILRYDPSMDPVMKLDVYGSENLLLLRDLAENSIKRRLEAVPGVAAVKVKGGLERQIRVELDENRMSGLSLDINEIASRLAQENINIAGGNLKEGSVEYIVRTLSEFRSVEEIGEIIITRRGEAEVKLKDIASISDGFMDKETVTRFNGSESVEIEIYKEADANIVSVAAAVKYHIYGNSRGELTEDALKKIKKGPQKKDRGKKPQGTRKLNDSPYPPQSIAGSVPDGIKIRITTDQSGFVVESIREVKSTAIFGGLLAVMVLYIFLRKFSHTAIIGAAIPVSIIATFAPMNLGGVSLNIMSLGGLALGIGMLVDNSIVVLESIFRCREEGDEFVASVIRGTGEVGGAVVASTLTTIAVFFPIVFVEGIAGQVFGDMGLTVVFSLLASLGAALFLIPMLASRKIGDTGEGGNPFRTVSELLLTPVSRLQSFDHFINGWNNKGFFGRLTAAAVFPFHFAFEIPAKVFLIVLYLAAVPVFIPLSVTAAAVLAAGGKMSFPAVRENIVSYSKTFAVTPYMRFFAKSSLPSGDEEKSLFSRTARYLQFSLYAVLEICGKIFYPVILLGLLAILCASLILGIIIYAVFRYFLFPVIGAALSSLGRIYPGLLEKALKNNAAVVTVSFVLLGLSFLLVPGLGTELIPEVHQGNFTLEMTLPVGTPLEVTDAVAAKADEIIIKDAEVEYVSSSVGSDKDSITEGAHGEHTAVLSVTMKKGGNLKIREQQLTERLRRDLRDIPGVDMKFCRPAIFSFKTPVEIEIKGYNLEILKELSDSALRELGTINGLSDLESNMKKGNPEVQIHYDRNRLSMYNLDIYNVASIVRSKIKGSIATEYKEAEKSIDVLVTLAEKDRDNLDNLRNLVVNPGSANSIRLSSVASVTVGEGPSEIRRIDQQRAALITANISGFDLGTASEKIRNSLAGIAWPENFSYSISGQSKEMMVSLNSLRNALLLAIFLVYIVMASQFESVIHPLIILLTIPMALIGVISMLYFTGTPLSIVVFLGMIMLAGIVVNNAIVLVDYINHLIRGGMERNRAIILAGSVRLRPILMTTATTVLGLLPMALGLGEGAEIRTPMAFTVIAGLLSSTLLTLIVIPSLYSLAGSAMDFVKARISHGTDTGTERRKN